jgi:type II secretory pathway pseudopilin PulG
MVRRTRGMTLVEVLVSLLIAQVGVAGTLAVVSTAMQGGTFARNLGDASRLAQSRLEALDSLAGVTLTSPTDGATVEAPMNGFGSADPAGPYTRSTTWSVTGDGLRRHIDVIVSWTDPRGKSHSASASRDRVP